MAVVFTLFPQLITELRLEIWRLALPNLPTRPLYCYRAGCWVVEEIGPQWDGPDPNGENLQQRLDTSLLEHLHIPLSLYPVNRKARDVAVEYLQKHKLVASRSSARSGFEMLRPFDPQTDTIFLPAAYAHVFGGEPGDVLHVTGMVDRYVSRPYSALKRLAVTPAGLEALKVEPMDAFLCEGGMIDKLYVVDAAPGCMLSVQDLEKAGQFPLVGLEETYRARLTWNSSRREWIASGTDSEARV